MPCLGEASLLNNRSEFPALPVHLAAGPDAPDPRDWLAAIINGSDDAIISKNLNGIIQSWNAGATRLFGYEAHETIGKSVTLLIPSDRLNEEPMILAEIHKGNRVDHFETKRRRKDGSLIDISLTISPIRNEAGEIVGASKIARDITGRLLAQQQQQLLIGEMQHRVKNLFALANAIVAISARSTGPQADIIADVQARLAALARAHELILSDPSQGPDGGHGTLHSLIHAIIKPYATDDRIRVRGDDCDVGAKTATNLALLLHEWATNAAKYGALSTAGGCLDIEVLSHKEAVSLVWKEAGGPAPLATRAAGFGSRLEHGLATALNATVERDWQHKGLTLLLLVPKASLTA